MGLDGDFERRRRAEAMDPDDATARLAYLTARARRDGPCAFLDDRAAWGQQPEAVQDEAIEQVGEILGGGFWPRETRRFECGGQRHRIGAFEHRKSGVLLHLVPGGYETAPGREGIRIGSFLIGRYPLLCEERSRIDESHREDDAEGKPAGSLSWFDALDWLDRAGDRLRLPSEAEWEYAAMGGTATIFPWGGSEVDPSYCWFAENGGRWIHHAHEHDEQPNAFGLVDVLGNVWEWCLDPYYVGRRAKPSELFEIEEVLRVRRGGSCYSHRPISSIDRDGFHAMPRNFLQGFRVARSWNGHDDEDAMPQFFAKP